MKKQYHPPPTEKPRFRFRRGDVVRIRPDGIPMTVLRDQPDGVIHVSIEERGGVSEAWFEHWRLERVP